MFDLQELVARFNSGYGTVAIATPIGSELKLQQLLIQTEVANHILKQRDGNGVVRQPEIWDIADGLQATNTPGQIASGGEITLSAITPNGTAKPGEPPVCTLLRHVIACCQSKTMGPRLFIVYHLDKFLGNTPQSAPVVRLLKNACDGLNRSRHRMVLIHSNADFSAFGDLIHPMVYPLPDEAETETLVRQTLQNLQNSARANRQELPCELSNDDCRRVVRSLMGLTTEGQTNLLQFAVRSLRAIDSRLPAKLNEEKRKALALEGIEYAPPADVDVQGLSALDEWVADTNAALHPRAQQFNITANRGLLLIGPPGTGKSLFAKAASARLGLACLVLNFGGLMDSRLGESEKQLMRMLKAAEQLSPCILFADEVDKGLNPNASGSSDGGTSNRMLASFLQWLNDHTAPVIVIATCNRPWSFTPEFLARFDRLFVDLPCEMTRRNIWQAHLQLRKLLPDPLPEGSEQRQKIECLLAELAQVSEDFSGREIAQVTAQVAKRIWREICQGDRPAMASDATLLPLDTELLLAQAKAHLPQQRGNYEERERLLAWTNQGNAVLANPAEPVVSVSAARTGDGIDCQRGAAK